MAAQIRAGLKRTILSSLADQVADDQNTTLLDALKAYRKAMVTGIQGGRIIEATSQNGHSTKFRIPVMGEHFRQEDMAELSGEFCEIYNFAVFTLATVSTDGSADPAILQQMLDDDRLQSISTVRHDYTLQSWPNYF